MTIGWVECLIVLIVLIAATGLAFRIGHQRGRRRE